MAKSLSNQSIESPSEVIERKAINSAGSIGSLYDASRDQLIHETNRNYPKQWLPASRPVQCKLATGIPDSNFNILEFINIQDELRLSLWLTLTKREGVAKVLDFSHYTDQYTYILYYSWIKNECNLSNTQQFSESCNTCINATHVINRVLVGIDLVVIVHSTSTNEIRDTIDSLFKKIRRILLNEENCSIHLTHEENCLLGHLSDIKVYSNSETLTSLSKLHEILHQIQVIKNNFTLCRPVTYILKPTTSFCNMEPRKHIIFRALAGTLIAHIERHFINFRNRIKNVDVFCQENQLKPMVTSQKQLLNQISSQLSAVKQQYISEMQRFSKILIDARINNVTVGKIKQALVSSKQKALKVSIDQLTKIFDKLQMPDLVNANQNKSIVISSNTVGRSSNTINNSYSTRKQPNYDPSRYQSIASKNLVNGSHQSKAANSNQSITKTNNRKLNLHSGNVESYHSLPPQSNKTVSTSNKTNHNKNDSTEEAFTPTASLPSSEVLPIDDTINILLLGETGVGKSTFINAFANYLTFHSFEQAESSEPVVVIPVSFIITTGDNFEERTIEFGEVDSLNNENFNATGQSVTQHCRSYTFDLHDGGRRMVRIIDTPGFGDTRGTDQDDQNIEHILQYINNLTHLNAICFLLKPNASRLNVFFRTCFTQLFSLLSPAARHNTIFCFTNARSTFYAPGNTAPLLKTMLAESSMSDITFKKENTFCFDSESFRYLVALQSDVSFGYDEKTEYEHSWSTSVKESNRLIDYINIKLIVYRMENGWQSIKHAQFEISYMIRPILEAIRNILRNTILWNTTQSNQQIEQTSKPVSFNASRCRSCKGDPDEVGQFWILLTRSHEIQNNSYTCLCNLDQHVPIEYSLEYKCSNHTSTDFGKRMVDTLKCMYQASAIFSHFLIHTAFARKDDPFLTGFREMIAEETYLCTSKTPNDFNRLLLQELSDIENKYKQETQTMKSADARIDLPAIYELISIIGGICLVREQLVAVKKRHRMIIEQYEYEAQKI
ncbi:unnamed protein product [Rotaria socialis]|uniref:G domain-containing protein n=1 Tax=Rotaria socialis TaxID=392032 RepID=A0A817T6L4_9BILA|nr:unnamed protein product [Rotaria socialis]CAF3592238.1 unnamed protein product [Rotaria socialis]